MKYTTKYSNIVSRILLFLMLFCFVLAQGHAVTLAVPLSADEQKAIFEYPNWVGNSNTCGNSSSSSSVTVGSNGSASITDINLADPGRANRPVGVTIYQPTDNQPHPLVLFAPGRFQDSKQNDFYSNFLTAIASQGFVVAGINFSDNSTQASWTADTADVGFLAQKLPSLSQLQGKLVPGVIGLIGHSDGAAVAVQAGYGASSQVPGLTAVVEMDGAVPSALKPGPPLLLMHGTDDQIEPITSSDDIYQQVSAPYKGYVKVIGGDHYSYFTGRPDNGKSYAQFVPAADAVVSNYLKRFLNGAIDNSTKLSTVVSQYPSELSLQETGSDTPAKSTPLTNSSSSSNAGSACCNSASTPSGGSKPTGGSSDLGQNAGPAFIYLTQKGFSPIAAAAMVGNWNQESVVNPADGGGGLAQWQGSRFTAMQAFVAADNNPNPLDGALDFVIHELASYPTAQADMKSATDIVQATIDFEKNYEMAGVPDMSKRINYAQEILADFGGQAATSSSGCGSGTPGQYMNPLRSVQNLGPERVDDGVDYSGQGAVYAMGNGVIHNLINSGWNYGGFDAFISYQLSDGPAKGDYVYVAEACPPVSTLHIGDAVNTSTIICNIIPGGTGIETGWATPPGNGTALSAGGFTSGSTSAALGINYNQLLVKLGAPSGNPVLTSQGSLPPGWPTW